MASEALFGTNTNNLDAGLSTSLQNSTKLNSASNPLGNNSTLTSLQPTFRASNFGNALASSPSSDWVSEGKFGDFDGRNDFQLAIKVNGNQETFSLTGHGYGEVFKDINNNYEYVSFAGTDKTTKVQISAINNIRFGDYLGSTLNVHTNGNITTSDILSNGGAINLTSYQESVTTKGNITTTGGNISLTSSEGLVAVRVL